MKSLYLAAALSLAAIPAMAQSAEKPTEAPQPAAKVGVPTTDQDTHQLLLKILNELVQLKVAQVQMAQSAMKQH